MAVIPLICLTGGPCAGKSTALAFLRDGLTKNGYHLFTVPEAATLLFGNGVKVQDLLDAGRNGGDWKKFQNEIMRMQLHLEHTFLTLAELSPAQNRLVITDRGLLDNAAYLDPESFAELLKCHGLSYRSAGERYHAVVHLESAALHHRDVWNAAKNGIRYDSWQEAVEADAVTKHAWSSHPNLTVIPSYDSWEEKASHLYRTITEAYERSVYE